MENAALHQLRAYTPVRGKIPFIPGWQHHPMTLEEARDYENSTGAGVIHQCARTAALDVDDLPKAAVWLDDHHAIALEPLLDPESTFIIETPAVGRAKALFRLPEDVNLPTIKVQDDAGMVLELRAGPGVQDVMPGSVYPGGGTYGHAGIEEPSIIPAELLEAWQTEITRRGNSQHRPAEIVDSSIPEGSRDNTLTSLAGTMRRRGMTQGAIEAALHEENRARCQPLLPESQVQKIAHSIGSKPPDPTAIAGAGIGPIDPEITPPPLTSLARSLEALSIARLSPRCIVKDYLYADVALLAAQGGTGKTTLLLYEAIRVALGHPLWGLEVKTPGKTVIVTAEDSKEICHARLWRLMQAMGLSQEEMQTVVESVLIWDVSGEGLRLVRTKRDIELTSLADRIVDAYQGQGLVQVLFDPMVSFGASEQSVNDNEQALVNAARRIRRGLDCCVRYSHHTGQEAARNKTLDQYASRGGSAMPDGARMVAILHRWGRDDKLTPPAGCLLKTPEDSINVLARPKVSYASPNLPNIWILRSGWSFEHFIDQPIGKSEKARGQMRQLEQFLLSEVKAGRYPTARNIEDGYLDELNMSRAELRETLGKLRHETRIISQPLPMKERQGARKEYLCPASIAPEIQEESAQ